MEEVQKQNAPKPHDAPPLPWSRYGTAVLSAVLATRSETEVRSK